MEPRSDQSSQPLMETWATDSGGKVRDGDRASPPVQCESDATAKNPQFDYELDPAHPTTALSSPSASVFPVWNPRDRQATSNISQALVVSQGTQGENGNADFVRSGSLRYGSYGRIENTSQDIDDELRAPFDTETHDDNASRNTVPPATEIQVEERADLWTRKEDPTNEAYDWQPYTLRQPFLSLLTVSTVALLIVLLSLQWYSATHHGLGSDDGSSFILFGWRFTPSVFAVLYVQMTAMLLNDVKRTEPLARMAKGGGGPARYTIWKVPRAWWTALADGFSKKKNGGHRSWLLIAASAINIVGFLAISPLSASLLESANIQVSRAVGFSTLLPWAHPPLPLSIGRETYLRIIGHFLQNVSTSAWITENFYVVPFWPKDAPEMPVGPILEGDQRIWRAESLALTTDMECESLSVASKTWHNVTYYDFHIPHVSLLLKSESGCSYNLTTDAEFGLVQSGGALWTNNASFVILGCEGCENNLQLSKGCEEHELMILSSPWGRLSGSNFTYSPNFTITGWDCRSSYYTATVESSARTSGTPSTVQFSQSYYEEQRMPVEDASLSRRQFESLAFNSSWEGYFDRPALSSDCGDYYGLSPMLAALYNFNYTAMMRDHDLLTKARAVKQRLFGEVLQYSMLQNGSIQSKTFTGNVDGIGRRVVMVIGTSITMMALLGIEFCLLLVAWSCVRKSRRPLNVRVDPSTTTGAVCILQAPRGGESPTFKDVGRVTGDQTVSTGPNGLHLSHDMHDSLYKESAPNLKQDWRPGVLRLRVLGPLVLFMVALLTAIIILYSFASKSLLRNTAFVYQTEVSIFDHPMPAVTPFPIIATLLSVGVPLWWSAMDVVFRRLQPFVSMAAGPTAMAEGASLTYEGSYWFVAAWKAIKNKHWTLCFITLGTSLTPIFTITMSALFQRGQGDLISIHEAERQLELRRSPFVIECPDCTDQFSQISDIKPFVSTLYLGLATNWLYSATIQLALNGSQPPWSMDAWSFVPLELARAVKIGPIQDLGASPFTQEVTVSLTTPAVRGRVECSGYEELADTSAWLTPINPAMYINASLIPDGFETAYILGADLGSGGTFFNTTIFAAGFRDNDCCANQSTQQGAGFSALGYWSADLSNSSYSWPFPNSTWPLNFTTKWIYGDLIHIFGRSIVDNMEVELLIYKDIPSVQALHCQPIIESTVANVTLDPHSGKVHSFSVTSGIVNASEAWNDAFVDYYGLGTPKKRPLSMAEANLTGIYGVVFMDALLGSTILDVMFAGSALSFTGDDIFSFRDPSNGLNSDFMTYSMFAMVNKDPNALLDASTMQRQAEKTFSTFFQHFVSSNGLSATTPSWAYQELNASLPDGVEPIDKNRSIATPGTPPTNRTALVEVSTKVELLRMNAVAVWLSVAILSWLIITTVTIAALQRKYLRNLDRNVECLGDVLVLVARSERLLRLVRERGPHALADERAVKTQLGWFEDGDGERRWGIEVVEGEAG